MSFISRFGSRIRNAFRNVHHPGEPAEGTTPQGAHTIAEKRALTVEERQLVEWLIEHGDPEAKLYSPQLPGLRVVSHCSCGCPTVDFAVEGSEVSTVGPSHLLADFLGKTPDGIDVGIILHARAGKISELEVYPFGQTPTSLPTIETLVALTELLGARRKSSEDPDDRA
jgi:hypothetical protein